MTVAAAAGVLGDAGAAATGTAAVAVGAVGVAPPPPQFHAANAPANAITAAGGNECRIP
jgi:hypothetical protein